MVQRCGAVTNLRARIYGTGMKKLTTVWYSELQITPITLCVAIAILVSSQALEYIETDADW